MRPSAITVSTIVDTVQLLGVRVAQISVPAGPTPFDTFEAKCEHVMALFRQVAFNQAMVFCNLRGHGEVVASMLSAHGIQSVHIMGAQDQSARLEAMAVFRSGAVRILVSTDLVRGAQCWVLAGCSRVVVRVRADSAWNRRKWRGSRGESGPAAECCDPAASHWPCWSIRNAWECSVRV
jgi:superfamily II DNA/RNA helicase